MTTTTTTTVLNHASTAGFEAWGLEFNTMLAAVGLVQTSDTGQINWGTVAIPAANTIAGYEVWRFADSSLYLKFEYGTSTSAAIPQIFCTVGQGSNGAGTLSGQLSARNTIACGVTVASTTTAYASYVCLTANSLSIAWKILANSSLYPYAYVCIGKTVDNTGAATTIGYGVLRLNSSIGGPTMQSVKLTSVAATNNDTSNFIVFPGNPSSSQTGANIQAYLCWLNVHQVSPFLWACGYILTEQLKLNPFSVNLVSTPTHSYLPIGQITNSSTLNGQSGATYSLAFIYE